MPHSSSLIKTIDTNPNNPAQDLDITMSTTFEGPTMYERDMRSANKEWRRSKNGSTKWAFGARPLAGCKLDLTTLEPATGSESQRAKVRPARGGKQ